MHNLTPDEYNKLMFQLKYLDIKELILLYVEASTGPLEKREYIPLYLLDELAKLQKMLDKYYGDRILDNMKFSDRDF